jgi:hypothetical protein
MLLREVAGIESDGCMKHEYGISVFVHGHWKVSK